MTEHTPAGGTGRFFGSIMVVTGILILTASGLCTTYVVGGMIALPLIEGRPFPVGQELDVFMAISSVALIVGTLGAGVGLVLWLVGRNLRPKT
jgi:hypothetical protein